MSIPPDDSKFDNQYFECIRNRIPWTAVRTVGELHILTKASYAALIIVPIIAGLWPTVRVVVNRYNVAAVEASKTLQTVNRSISDQLNKLETAAAQLAKATGNDEAMERMNVAADKIAVTAETLQEEVDSFADQFHPKTLKAPTLPLIWAYTFFGSLAVVIAQASYQASAPEIIHNYTIGQYEQKKREDRMKTKSTSEDIEEAAREAKQEYERVARNKDLQGRLIPMVLYTMGILLILMVVFEQCVVVFSAAVPQ